MGEWYKMNQSVAKAIALIDLFQDEGELSLQEIANRADIPKSTAYRLLMTLETGQLLEKVKTSTHDSRYRLGLKWLQFGELVTERLKLRDVALPFMEKLAAEINEVVHLVIVNNSKAIYIEKVNSRRVLSLHTQIGRRMPLYIGSGPKLLLAYLPKEKQDDILASSELYTLTNSRKINKNDLRKELIAIRKNEISYSVDEQDDDTTGVSFPIFDYKNEVVAALAISGLSNRFQGKALENIKIKGSQKAKEISRQLGYREI